MVIRLRVGTILFGALPATCLAVPAGLLFAVGVELLLSADVALVLTGLFLICWSGAGLCGTLSLWAIGFGLRHEILAQGLTAGLIAVAPMAGLYGLFAILGGGWFVLAAVTTFAPAVVAWRWLDELREDSMLADNRQAEKDRAVRDTELRTAR